MAVHDCPIGLLGISDAVFNTMIGRLLSVSVDVTALCSSWLQNRFLNSKYLDQLQNKVETKSADVMRTPIFNIYR